MRVIPLTLKQANALVKNFHRHHKPVHAHRFSIGARSKGKLIGACIVARPQAMNCEQYMECSVVRLVTLGGKNVCSFLYGAAGRIAFEMGFDKIRTEILENEPGTSLKAAGWTFSHMTKGGNYDRPSRKRSKGKYPEGPKQVWFKTLARVARVEVCGLCGGFLQGDFCPSCEATVDEDARDCHDRAL